MHAPLGQSCIAPGIRLRPLPRDPVSSFFTRNARALMRPPGCAGSMLLTRVLEFVPNDYTAVFTKPCRPTESFIGSTNYTPCMFAGATPNFTGCYPQPQTFTP